MPLRRPSSHLGSGGRQHLPFGSRALVLRESSSGGENHPARDSPSQRGVVPCPHADRRPRRWAEDGGYPTTAAMRWSRSVWRRRCLIGHGPVREDLGLPLPPLASRGLLLAAAVPKHLLMYACQRIGRATTLRLTSARHTTRPSGRLQQHPFTGAEGDAPLDWLSLTLGVLEGQVPQSLLRRDAGLVFTHA